MHVSCSYYFFEACSTLLFGRCTPCGVDPRLQSMCCMKLMLWRTQAKRSPRTNRPYTQITTNIYVTARSHLPLWQNRKNSHYRFRVGLAETEEIVPAEEIVIARVCRSQLVKEHRVQSEVAVCRHEALLRLVLAAVADEAESLSSIEMRTNRSQGTGSKTRAVTANSPSLILLMLRIQQRPLLVLTKNSVNRNEDI